MKELKEELRKVIKTGKVLVGSEKVIKSLLTSDPKLIIVSRTCPPEIAERIKYYSTLGKIPCVKLNKRSLDLGAAGGKPFHISTLGLIKEGESRILDIIKKK